MGKKIAGFDHGAVGNETKGNMKAVGLMGKSSLGHGVKELERQHPIKHDDRGPHHQAKPVGK